MRIFRSLDEVPADFGPSALTIGNFDGVHFGHRKILRRVQAIAVTHAPQVAARATAHLLVAKSPSGDGKRVVTSVLALDRKKRREEIARMLAGAEITAEARAAAERLIKAAG